MDLHQEQKRIEEHYQFKLLQNYSNASQAAYHLNQLLAEQVASSLMMDTAIYKVEIVDDFGDILTLKEQSISLQGGFTEALSSYLTPRTPVYTTELHQPNSHVVVGTLAFFRQRGKHRQGIYRQNQQNFYCLTCFETYC
ncbi:hypothetical protein QW180_06370 [Vibrio sinaloensis]|nr:hypothetical protein [Vibrio sinaloensis]